MFPLLRCLLFRPYDQVALIDQPVVELVSCETAVFFADQPYSFVLIGTFFFFVEFKLDRTLHIFTELPTFVIDKALDELIIRIHGSVLLLVFFGHVPAEPD